jgi:DNA-binding HxlR family transcriptional regulator
MDISLLVKIASKAWALTILSLIHRGVPMRQAPLLMASGAGRTALAQSFRHLVDIGLVERNPGHGHPLRPEFRLTRAGVDAAALAHAVLVDTGEADRALIRRAWTVPVLTALAEPTRFIDISTRLTPITDRALSQSLKAMEDRDWVRRVVDAEARPPRPVYRAVNRGAAIGRLVAESIVAW